MSSAISSDADEQPAIRQRLEKDGWVLVRVRGSHHVFRHPRSDEVLILPHPRKDLGKGLVRQIYRPGWLGTGLMHYMAVVEEAGADTAVGVWFPDLPGCFSAGDTVEEAIRNAAEALRAYAEAMTDTGRTMPAPRTLTELRRDGRVAIELREHLLALVSAPEAEAAIAS